MKVKNIHWIGCDEAEVEISDDLDLQTLVTFCHPCFLEKGDRVLEPLKAFDIGNAVISDRHSFLIKKQANYGYYIIAKVISSIDSLVEVNGILIRLSYLPVNCQLGEFV